ncbi:biological adhesion [Mactra antiquata]
MDMLNFILRVLTFECDNITVVEYSNRKITIANPDYEFTTYSKSNCAEQCFEVALDDIPCVAVFLQDNRCKIYRSCSLPATFQYSNENSATAYQVTCDTLSTPRCCAAPPLKDGSITYNGVPYTVGRVATHTCNPGFALTGNVNRTCLNDTTWDGQKPSCDAVDCGTPISIPNADISMPHPQTVLYTCHYGFILNGSAVLACGANNEWPPRPICTPIDCEQPTSVAYSTINVTSTLFGGTAFYTCDVGFTLIGTADRNCAGDGNWTSAPPVCSLVDCGTPSTINNGSVNFGNTTYQNSANYSCDYGFVLIGQPTHVCEENGLWSHPSTYCVIDCGVPPNIAHGGTVIYNTTFDGSIATYDCNLSCEMSGPNQTTCLSDGLWNNTVTNCSCIQCQQLIPPVDGFVVVSDGLNVGSVATYSCLSDYLLYGQNTSNCSDQGTWTSSPPVCHHPGTQPPSIYLMPCICKSESFFTDMTPDEIVHQLIKDTKIDVKKTGKALQKLNCLEDSRESSKVIGTAGTIFISVIFGLIVILDCFSIFPKCQSKHAKPSLKNSNRDKTPA